jgi:hypothetical protein
MEAFDQVVALFWGAVMRTPLVPVDVELLSMHGLCPIDQYLALKRSS